MRVVRRRAVTPVMIYSDRAILETRDVTSCANASKNTNRLLLAPDHAAIQYFASVRRTCERSRLLSLRITNLEEIQKIGVEILTCAFENLCDEYRCNF